MKTTKILTRNGTFTVIVAVKGPRGAQRAHLKHALEMAFNRIVRDERRFEVLRQRRAKTKLPRVIQRDVGVWAVGKRVYSSRQAAIAATKKGKR